MLHPIRLRIIPRVSLCKRILWLVILANVGILAFITWSSSSRDDLRSRRNSRLELRAVEVPDCNCKRPQYASSSSEETEGQESPETRCPTSTSTVRGWKQRVISFSMYNKLSYLERVPGIADSAEKLYPSSEGWVIRIHHDFQPSSDHGFKEAMVGFTEAMCNITCKHGNVDFCDMRLLNPPASTYFTPAVHPMVWRFMPMADQSVEVFLSRDLDSDLTAREASAVKDWLGTDSPLHIMRDNPLHGTVILGGMWGARKSPKYENIIKWEKVEEAMLNRSRENFGGGSYSRETRDVDQSLLAQTIYPAICNMHPEDRNLPREAKPERLCHVHDSYLCNTFKDSVPWPTRRLENVTNNFVGANGHPPMLQACPLECRPKDHQDWQYC